MWVHSLSTIMFIAHSSVSFFAFDDQRVWCTLIPNVCDVLWHMVVNVYCGRGWKGRGCCDGKEQCLKGRNWTWTYGQSVCLHTVLETTGLLCSGLKQSQCFTASMHCEEFVITLQRKRNTHERKKCGAISLYVRRISTLHEYVLFETAVTITDDLVTFPELVFFLGGAAF